MGKTAFIFQSFALIFCVSIAASGAEIYNPSLAVRVGGETNIPSIVVASSEVLTNLQLFVSMPRNVFANGQPIVLSVDLNNSASAGILVPPVVPTSGLAFAITNAEGFSILLRPDLHGDSFSGPSSLLIMPHSQMSYPVDLARYYNLKPGTYRIRATRELAFRPPWRQTVVSSDVITIHVAPQDGK